jgi:hypothetical protein
VITTAQAVAIGVPRWMVLAMPDDVSQIVALADIEYATPGQRRAARNYYLRELRRTQWERRPCRPAKRPACLRPSRNTSGYRTDSAAHREARLKVNPELRREIARKGQKAWQTSKDETFSRA